MAEYVEIREKPCKSKLFPYFHKHLQEVIRHFSSIKSIKNYLNAVGQFKLPADIDTSNTQIVYFYGGKINEFVFRNVAKYIKKNYKNAVTICLKGKGHCEDALLHSNEWIKQLDKYII